MIRYSCNEGYLNLSKMFARADAIDLDEGMLAYTRYHMVLSSISKHYDFPLPRVVAVFCSLSPNSDYMGNLRSAVTVLKSIKEGTPQERTTVSTYRHCMLRAWDYAIGAKDFETQTKGPKILNFYHNILNPKASRWCTIDGHMSAIWQGKELTMKEALVSSTRYQQIKDDVSILAVRNDMLPNQMQAVLWFTRKRTSNIVYVPQMKLFGDRKDLWNTLVHVEDIRPYIFKSPEAEFLKENFGLLL